MTSEQEHCNDIMELYLRQLFDRLEERWALLRRSPYDRVAVRYDLKRLEPVYVQDFCFDGNISSRLVKM